MAEFCLECWNQLNQTNDPPARYILSRDMELCEGCAEYKHVIIKERTAYRLRTALAATFRKAKERY